VNTMCIELRAHEYHVMVSSVGDSEVFDERESPEMTEALLLRLLSHRLQVLQNGLVGSPCSPRDSQEDLG